MSPPLSLDHVRELLSSLPTLSPSSCSEDIPFLAKISVQRMKGAVLLSAESHGGTPEVEEVWAAYEEEFRKLKRYSLELSDLAPNPLEDKVGKALEYAISQAANWLQTPQNPLTEMQMAQVKAEARQAGYGNGPRLSTGNHR